MAASNLYTTYSDANKQMGMGKTQRVTSTACDNPQYTIQKQANGQLSCFFTTWYHLVCVSTAQYSYVGMTRTAAEQCAADMTTKFTRQKPIWKYEIYYNPTLSVNLAGWHTLSTDISAGRYTPVLESNINVVHDQGAMYHVDVDVECIDEVYTMNPAGYQFSYPSCMQDI